MATTLKEKMEQLDLERRARIEAETARLHGEYLTLQKLRKAMALTQVQIAKTLNVQQSSVSEMEQRSDLLLSTLRGYVEAMGGRLKLVAEFPARPPVLLSGIGDLDSDKRRAD